MVAFAHAVGDSLPNIHTDATLAQKLGMADAVVDGRMLAIVVSHQLRECLEDNGMAATVAGLDLRFRHPVHPGLPIMTRVRAGVLVASGDRRAELEVVRGDGTVAVTGHAVLDVKGDSNARTKN
jgi:acyl dehydratase